MSPAATAFERAAMLAPSRPRFPLSPGLFLSGFGSIAGTKVPLMTDTPKPTPGSDDPASQPPAFDSAAEHHQRPRLRKIRAFPVPAKGPDDKQIVLMGLADAQQISTRPPVVVLPAMQQVLALFDGTRTVEAIVEQMENRLKLEQLQTIVAQLDGAGLLFGPTFDAMLVKMRADFDGSDMLPPGSSAQMADLLVMQANKEATEEEKAAKGPDALKAAMDQWIDKALEDKDDPAFDALPAGLVAPHVDYLRGWMNYAAVWGRMRVVDRPDRVVILGTNHFGLSTGVCACDKGYTTPLGESPKDAALEAALREALGEQNAGLCFENRYDHENEHSIELQVPWIQHCLGTDDQGQHVPVFGALIHDPTVNQGESYDGSGLALEPFIEALKTALDKVGGKTLVVSSADLSHVGPAFGDQQPLVGDAPEAQEARNKTVKQDQELLAHVQAGKMDDLISSVAWQGNPTRWCSIGNLVAMLKLTGAQELKLLNYSAALDPQGMSMVSSAALVTA